MFHLTHHRPTTVQVEAMAEPAEYVIFKDLAPTMEMPAVRAVPIPQAAAATRSAAMWAHVRQLAAENDAALTPMDQADAKWYSAMLVRLATLRQGVMATVDLHARWEAHWQQRVPVLNQRAAVRAGDAMDAAYAEGGTSQLVGLVEQVRAMMSAQIQAGSAVSA